MKTHVDLVYKSRTIRFSFILGTVAFLQAFTHSLAAGTLNVAKLEDYANQPIPSYITKDNTGDNPITDEAATLGRVLFYDKHLSTTLSLSCASCHQQKRAFSDSAEKSQGVAGLTDRHSPRLINTRFASELNSLGTNARPRLKIKPPNPSAIILKWVTLVSTAARISMN